MELIDIPKGYWVSCVRKINDPDKMATYGKLAGPAIVAAGGKVLARGVASASYEAGLKERTVLIEFESVAAAMACHDSPAYQAALKAFDGGAERDLRIIEALK
ncbi:MAG TPA: DUF1330 domain-containing protein [Pseudolabrys sp.]